MSKYAWNAEEFDTALGDMICFKTSGISGIDVVSILLKSAAWFVEAWPDDDKAGRARLIGILRDAEERFAQEYDAAESAYCTLKGTNK